MHALRLAPRAWVGSRSVVVAEQEAVVGLGAGLVNGSLIAYTGIPPFIATLGMMLILRGLSLVISGTRPIYFNDTPGFSLIANGSLIGWLIPALPIPNGVLILFLVAGAVAWLSEAFSQPAPER